MPSTRIAIRPHVTEYKCAPMAVGMNIQAEKILYGRHSRRKYYL
jgi:hypothetical protein